jgi:hypothetical protein
VRKKIVIVISSNEYYTNYIKTNAFKEIKNKYDIFYYVSSKIKKNFFKGIKKVHYYKSIKKNVIINEKIFHLIRNRYLKKSSSFEIRNRRFYGLNLSFKENVFFFIKCLKIVNRLIIFIFHKFYFLIFKNFFLFNLYVDYLSSKKIEDRALTKFMDKINPNLILIPSQAEESFADSVIEEANKRNIKSAYLVDNWDNLSSKTVLINKPSHLGVWGKQSQYHAIKIHNFKKKDISIIGTPRYDIYFKSRNKKIKSHFNFKYILFLGSFLPSNEEKIIKFLDHFLLNNKKITNNVKLIYRPHPQRLEKNFNIKSLKLKKTLIDPQLINEKKIINFKYYPSLIKNAQIVIGGLTSMIIESCIMKKNYICIVHKYKNLLIDPHTAYKKMVHFKHINKLRHVYISNNCQDLKNYLNNFFKKKLLNKNKLIELDYFIKYNSECYSKGLLKLVLRLI